MSLNATAVGQFTRLSLIVISGLISVSALAGEVIVNRSE